MKTEWDEWEDWGDRGEWEASSSVKAENAFPQVESAEKVEDERKGSKKRTASRMVSQGQLDMGLDLDSLAPKHAVNVFLGRYAGRAIQVGKDYYYSTVALPIPPENTSVEQQHLPWQRC